MEKINVVIETVRNYRVMLYGLGIIYLGIIILKRFSSKFVKYKKMMVRNIDDTYGKWARKVHWTDRILYLLIPWKKTCTLRIRGLPKIRIQGWEENPNAYQIANDHSYFYILYSNEVDCLAGYYNFKEKYAKRKIGDLKNRVICPRNYYEPKKGGTLIICDDMYKDLWVLVKR